MNRKELLKKKKLLKRIKQLEKALWKACNGLCWYFKDYADERYQWEPADWERWAMGNDEYCRLEKEGMDNKSMIELNELEKAWIRKHLTFNPEEMENLLNKCEFSDLGEALKQAEMLGAYQVIKNRLEEMDDE